MYQFILALAQPYTILLLLMAVAIVNLWRKRRETRRRLLPLTVLFMALAVLSTPAVAHLVLGALEGQPSLVAQRPGDAEAIVVLAGGVNLSDETGAGAEPDSSTMHRCRFAAELYRRGPACPVLVSGGKVDPESPGPAFADVMRAFLQQLSVQNSDMIVECLSRNTYENAIESRKLLEEHHIRKIVLVTDAVHMHRALACFRKQGLEVIPAPCHFQAGILEGSVRDYCPNPNAVAACHDAFHEWLGTTWYWLLGRI
jgi:uncharacterized SAM-binding protein YcdF (DUF218 family)